MILVLFVSSCGSGDQQIAAHDSAATSTTTRIYSLRAWYDAAYADSPTRIRLTFDGPTGGACEEFDEAIAHESGDEVTVEVRYYAPFVDTSCTLQARSVIVKLTEPLGARRLRRTSDDTAFQDFGGQLKLIPESTPCGRADCSTPSPAPAPCTHDAYDQAVRQNVDGGLTPADPRCDGSFLVLTIANNSACQPEQYGRDCTKNQSAFFVAKDATWNVVTLGRGVTCEDVWRISHIRFPAALCPPA